MSVSENIVFIGHATPEDNNFAIWLASRLQLFGFKVWLDKENLLGGEKTWQEIDQVIRNNTIKYLLVYSKNICLPNQTGKLKEGIDKEFQHAESILKSKRFTDPLILLNLDNSPYDLFIGANRLNHISFGDNWATGLKQLVQKLEKDGVPKNTNEDARVMGEWYQNKYTTDKGIIPKKELYYTNWWQILQLPENFYIYQFENESEAESLISINKYPAGKMSNSLATFDPKFSFEVDRNGSKINFKPKRVFCIKVQDVLNGFEQDKFPTCRDAENHLKRLLSRVFHELLKSKGLYWYQMANKGLAYFYALKKSPPYKISFEYPYRPKAAKKKTKSLVGDYLNLGNWHYGVSAKVILKPFPAYCLKGHIIFTTDGFKVWDDKDKMHSHRRNKGKNFFNEAWRDMLMAFVHGLENSDKVIELSLSQDFILKMPTSTVLHWADFGYWEPQDEARLDVLRIPEDRGTEEVALIGDGS